MPKAAASSPHDLFDLTDPDPEPDDDSLDLEAYLDLEESPEITRLMRAMRGQGSALSAPPAAPERAAAREALPPVPAPRGRATRGGDGRLDLAAVARALGEVHVQARQLVVTCPRCEGRASIVVYADRFKCFGCEATGNERALAAHLTGWDPRRVDAWLEAAAASPEVEEADVRRPWRLSLFAR